MKRQLKKLNYKAAFVIKKNTLCLACLLFSLFSFAQKPELGITGEKNWMRNWTNFKPQNTNYKESTHELFGAIKYNTTLKKENVYILQGKVYITNKAVLTIEPGTIIKGDINSGGALIITKGSQIIAEGKETDPIIFTSDAGEMERRPGDWGGIVVLGDAPTNKIGNIAKLNFDLDNAYSTFGGDNPESYSGILKYVRIEYAGKHYNGETQFNGLSLAGVGNKTILENIQVSFSNDDSFNFYGGNVKMSNLISYKASDDDFDFAQGVQCTIDNSLALRSPYSSNSTGSTCFEIDSYEKGDTTVDHSKKNTSVTANNIALVNLESNDQGLIKEAITIKENATLSLTNAIICDFKCPIYFNDAFTQNIKNIENIHFSNLKLNNCKFGIEVESKTYETHAALNHWFNYEKNKISLTSIPLSELFVQPNINDEVDYRTSKKTTYLADN